MAEDLIGYERMAQEALRAVVRMALERAASPKGLPGKHHFYITFKTQAPGVIIAPRLTERYPEDMTIVLEHQFWDLKVDDDRFEVMLKFSGIPEKLIVPLMAITRFVDPHVRFGLHFEPPLEEPAAARMTMPPRAAAPRPPRVEDESPTEEQAAAAIVSLDAFRKK